MKILSEIKYQAAGYDLLSAMHVDNRNPCVSVQHMAGNLQTCKPRVGDTLDSIAGAHKKLHFRSTCFNGSVKAGSKENRSVQELLHAQSWEIQHNISVRRSLEVVLRDENSFESALGHTL
jgi:hypothetical protein